MESDRFAQITGFGSSNATILLIEKFRIITQLAYIAHVRCISRLDERTNKHASAHRALAPIYSLSGEARRASF